MAGAHLTITRKTYDFLELPKLINKEPFLLSEKKTKTKNITLALRYVIPYVIPCANNQLKVMRGDSHKELRQPENSLQCNLSLLVVKAVFACAPSPKSNDGPAMFCVCAGKLEGLDREKSRSDCFAHRREQQECFSSCVQYKCKMHFFFFASFAGSEMKMVVRNDKVFFLFAWIE